MEEVYKDFYQYLKPYFWQLIGGLFCLIFVGLVNLAFPWIFKFLIDDVLIAGNAHILNFIALGAVFLFLLKGIFNFLQEYLLSGLGQKVVVDLRNDVYQHLQSLSLSFFEKRKTGDLLSRITNDVNIIQRSLTTGLSNLVLQPLMIIGVVIFLIYIEWKLALVAIIIVPVIVYTINKFGNKMRAISTRIQEKLSIVTTILQETLSGIRIVKAFNMEEKEIDCLFAANQKTLFANLRGVKIKAIITPLVEIIIAVGSAGFLWYGGHRVLSGELQPGELVTFIGYIGLLTSPVRMLTTSYNFFQKAVGAAERIFELMAIEEKVKEMDEAVEMPEIKEKVEFKGIHFSYNEGEKVLKNINLKVNYGETVALVGHSGAGKTTLVNLIPRFYDVEQGQILIDGIDIKKVTIKSLRKQIGIVPQETVLFNGTITENIAYGSENKTREEIIQAACQANAHKFITEFENGYQTIVGNRGENLSGGQKQRISIARAVLTAPRILILDEATSNLDTESEELVKEALDRLMKDKTTFVIAHRLSTVVEADKIVVLEKGEIVEIGTHQELINNEEQYYYLYRNQIEEI